MTSTALRSAPAAPRRGRWLNLGTVAICGVLGLLFSLLVAGLTLETLPDPPRPEQDVALGVLLLLDLGAGALALIVLLVAGRRPAPWAAILIALAAVVSALAMPALILIVVRLAASRAHRLLVVVGSMSVAGAVVSDRLWATTLGVPAESWWQLAGLAVVVLSVPVLVGVARGRREAEVVALAEAAAAAERENAALVRQRAAEEREHEARLAQAKEAERVRIAREMHDSLAHHLSLIAVHAGVLEYRADLDPSTTREAAATVGSAARDANAELRTILGVLRTGQEAATPQPDLSELNALLTDGVTLLTADGYVAADVPAGTSRHAYRMVQEALTNARKHAPGQPATVRLAGAPSAGVSIEVRNPLATRAATAGAGFLGAADLGAGFGIAGMVERARLAGGWCRAGTEKRDADGVGEFVVTAWLPW